MKSLIWQPMSNYMFAGVYESTGACGSKIGLYRFDTSITPASNWNLTYFPGDGRYFNSVAYLPTPGLVLTGDLLTLVTATTMTMSKQVRSTYSGINFGYIVCIDSTTCIAADLEV